VAELASSTLIASSTFDLSTGKLMGESQFWTRSRRTTGTLRLLTLTSDVSDYPDES